MGLLLPTKSQPFLSVFEGSIFQIGMYSDVDLSCLRASEHAALNTGRAAAMTPYSQHYTVRQAKGL